MFHLKAGTLYPLPPQPGGKRAGHRLREGRPLPVSPPAVLPSDKGGEAALRGEGDGVAHLCRCRGPCAGGRCLRMPGPESVRGYLDAVEAQTAGSGPDCGGPGAGNSSGGPAEEFLAEGHPPERQGALGSGGYGGPGGRGRDLDRLTGPGPSGDVGLTWRCRWWAAGCGTPYPSGSTLG